MISKDSDFDQFLINIRRSSESKVNFAVALVHELAASQKLLENELNRLPGFVLHFEVTH